MNPRKEGRGAERRQMVDTQLAAHGIRAPAVLDAMYHVPRHFFVRADYLPRAYEDAALPAEFGQTISQPYMVARMTELLEPRRTDRILEVGTGTGYQTAVLAHLVERVFTIEWHMGLMLSAAARLERLGLDNVTYRCADGSLGWEQHAPFDGILVAAGAPELPQQLAGQLAVGGRLVIPVGPLDEQTLVRITRTSAGLREERLLQCRFVRLVGAAGWRV